MNARLLQHGPSRISCASPARLGRAVFAASMALLAVSLACPGLAQVLPTADPESVGMSSERLEVLDRAIQRWIDDGVAAGAVALVARNGKVVHLNAFGDRYLEAADAMEVDDIFYIQSMTKAVVSTALMMLFEEGHFLLDDPISEYLPEFADKMVVRETPDGPVREPAARPVTFRHVLTHTAGVDPDRGLLSPEERALLGGRGTTLAARIAARSSLPLAFHPGEEWDYGSSTDYVAVLVEAISGQSLDRFLEERLFDPLGMVDTGYNVPPPETDRIVAHYAASGPERALQLSAAPDEREPTTVFQGVAGLYSTAADYFRFSQMILNGGELNGVRVLSPTTVNLMVSNHVGDLPVRGCMSTDGYGFGLGFGTVTDVGLAREGLTPGAFGWCGIWNTVYWIDPVEETVALLMTQLSPFSAGTTMRRTYPGLVMQAIVESYHSGAGKIRAYDPIVR